MRVCVYVHICEHARVYVYVYMRVRENCLRMRVCVYACMCVCVQACVGGGAAREGVVGFAGRLVLK